MAKGPARSYLWSDKKRTFFGLPWSFTRYSLCEDRLFIKTGFLSIKEDEVRLYRIIDITLKMSLFQRIFGLGTIHCCSADHTMGEFDIKNIKNARAVKEMLSDAVEKERLAKRVFNREDMDVVEDDHHGGDHSGH